MRRWLAILTVLAVTACSGEGPRGGFLPSVSPEAARAKVRFVLTVPRRLSARFARPATISAETKSLGVTVNGGALQRFNLTPSSPGCSSSSSGTTCRLTVGAPAGTDAFTVATYSGTNATGAVLDRASMTAKVTLGKTNALTIRLGPVVSTTADSGPGSLRDAVVNARSGDTVLFVIAKTSTISLTSPIAVPNGITVAGNGTTIDGGSAHQLFSVASGAKVTISGLVLAHGAAKTVHHPGGAVYNAGTLTLLSDTFTHNSSIVQSPFFIKRHRRVRSSRWKFGDVPLPDMKRPHSCTSTNYEGGAVYNDGTLTITDSAFDSNAVVTDAFNGHCEVRFGGALYNDVDATLTVTGTIFTNNGALAGGAVYNNASTHAATFSSDTFKDNLGCNTAALGCATSGCTGGACTSEPIGQGVAIFDGDGPGVAIDSSTFSGNVAGGAGGVTSASAGLGGALVLEAGLPTITNSTFTNNVAGRGATNCSQGEGGAIYAAVPLLLNGDTFTGNSTGGDAIGFGGAIFDLGAPILGAHDTFTSNVAVGLGGTACAITPAAAAGAIVADTVALRASTFSHNAVTGATEAFGGAIFAPVAADLIGDSFDHNQVTATGGSDRAQGGAVYAQGNVTTSLSTLTSNTALAEGSGTNDASGGAIWATGKLTSAHDTFTSNLADNTGAAGSAAGGAFYGCCFSVKGDVFTGNSATATANGYGGALYVGSGGDSAQSTFASNSVTGNNAQGGAVYSSAHAGSFTGGSFTGNTAGTATQTGLGGAVIDAGGFSFSGTIFTNNVATARGGAVYANAAESFTNVTMSGNKVTVAGGSGVGAAGGGAIYVASGVNVTDSTIANNSVAVSSSTSAAGGGGIYENGGGAVIIGSTFSGNAVSGSGSTGSGGGAMFLTSGGDLFNDTLAQNTSTFDGGGIESHTGANIEIVNATIDGNSATGNGGNINNPVGSTLYLATSIVAKGTSAAGADIETSAASFTSQGYNISTTTPDGGTLNGTGDQPNTDPMLLALGDYGGPTKTMADTLNSPGTQYAPYGGTGSSSQCGSYMSANVAIDQRGYARGAYGSCDIGAFEFYGAKPAIKRPWAPSHNVRRPSSASLSPASSIVKK